MKSGQHVPSGSRGQSRWRRRRGCVRKQRDDAVWCGDETGPYRPTAAALARMPQGQRKGRVMKLRRQTGSVVWGETRSELDCTRSPAVSLVAGSLLR